MRWSRTYPAAALLVFATIASSLPAQVAETPDAQGDAPRDTTQIQTRIGAATESIRQDIETLDRFTRRAETLIRIARTNPTEALRQRLSMSECHASVLAPVCDRMTALFDPEQNTGGAGETEDAENTLDTDGGVQ